MECLTCQRDARSIGLVCAACAAAIATSVTPQQIVVVTTAGMDAALVDQWGRAHSLCEVTEIGRTVNMTGLAILDERVSRRHAEISHLEGAWAVRDFKSSNGTYVNREPITECVLSHGDRIQFGRISFYVVFHLGSTPTSVGAPPITCVAPVESPPQLALQILEPTGGGGGLVALANATAQLTTTQLELVDLLVRKMRGDAHLPEAVRGYVRSSELVGVLSWDTRAPDDSHVRQLVRRARRNLIRSGLGDLIESRHRFGYRLRVTQ
jgi:hypothetical protein